MATRVAGRTRVGSPAMAKAMKRVRAPPEQGGGLGREGALPQAADPFSASQFSNGPIGRFGDLFPLPLPADGVYLGELHSLRSRRSRQRVGRRRALLQRKVETVRALNYLTGFKDESSWPPGCLNQAQLSAISRIRRARKERAPAPESMSPQAALRQLLQKAGSSYGEGQPGQVVGFTREKLSLPRGQAEPVMLRDLLPPLEGELLDGFRDRMMLSDEEIAGVLEHGIEKDRFMDPVLEHSPSKYHELIADLRGANLLGYTLAPKVQVGLFCVSKKAGKQRLIIDARRANRLFKKPPSTTLGSVEAWGRLESDSEIFFAQEDVRDFFYRLQIPKPLGEFFSLPPLNLQLLKEVLGEIPSEIQDLAAEREAPIYPHLKVLPMGFSWAFHLAHVAHKELAVRTLPQAALIEDKRPAPRLCGAGPFSLPC